jgi:hypothetical protein
MALNFGIGEILGLIGVAGIPLTLALTMPATSSGEFKFLRSCLVLFAALIIASLFLIEWPVDLSLNTKAVINALIAAIVVGGVTIAWGWLGKKEEASLPSQPSPPQEQNPQGPQGGKGGSGEIFGNNGTVIGGKGGNVGPGGVGRGGDGGGGVVHGDSATIIGGEGGSVDGANIWFPPAQSGFIQFLESQGQTPDFDVQYPGAGGATGGWLQRQQIVVKIREEYFKKTGQPAKIKSSKIEDVPLTYINEKLKEAGYPWRARIEKKYWYLYYIP